LTLPPVPVTPIQGQYAIAYARAIIHDGGVADLVDLEFEAGYWRRAHIAPEWLRLGGALSGTWLVTFYFRTGPDGRLKEMPYVTAIRRVEAHDPSFVWQALSRLILINSASGQATFRVRPIVPSIKPFLLTAVLPVELQDGIQRDRHYHLTGTIEAERLLIVTIDRVEAPE